MRPAIRWDRKEISGSLGDLGTFIPLLVGMVTVCGLNAGSALFFAGLFNVITGLTFGLPMAVQPMKAIAAIAISEGLTPAQIAAAGILTSAVILILGLTNWISRLDRIIPMSVVRGLQLAVGLTLLFKGIRLIAGTGILIGYDSILTGLLGGGLVLVLFFSDRFPGALWIFLIGLGLLALESPELFASLRLDFSLPRWTPPAWGDFLAGGERAAVAQIPLTLLNSVIAVCALSRDLFPTCPATPRRVSISVGGMNLIAGWFGAMPMCHGSGGLAGQYRFGARSGGSVIFLGGIKIALGCLLGTALMPILAAYPESILGVLLVFSGMELSLITRDVKDRNSAFVMFLTASTSLALHSLAIGFVLGWVLSLLFLRGIIRTGPDAPGNHSRSEP